MNLITKIFGTYSEREVKRVRKIAEKIEALQEYMHKLSDEELKAKTPEFKKRLQNGETLDDLLPEAFATVREASRRVLGMEHYTVQLLGGIVLHQGRIAEMRTGEGKTLVSTCPAYLNALTGENVVIVTVNDYLATRDAEQMGQVHRFLGLTVGVITNDMRGPERKQAYACDITYVTNNELGFDYLRDNMVLNKNDRVLRNLSYAIIDEIDSVLIDEARTPLIISGQSNKSTRLYEACDMLAKQLKRGDDQKELSKMDILMGVERVETGDFIVDEKDKIINLTDAGITKVERFFHLDNLTDPENIEIQHCMLMSLKANHLMFRDRNYVVRDNKVMIVDEFTGRIMDGRRYSDGLHQAIEAKEHVKIKKESKTLATITFQNFFQKFKKKSGMTGTALTEEKEFRNIYGLDVVVIPTHRPIQRIDNNDIVYCTKREKYAAICDAVAEAHKKGQPVLVGTITIETSELLSNMLLERGIPHNVLNAKYHEQEAAIVADAGLKGAVTIATNMAGRGTDIKLGPGVKELGGLKIIGTERHESRRIDNQLRGRAGRQGDVGESTFYISLEDDLLRLFGSEGLLTTMSNLGFGDGQSIEHKMLSNAIEKSQQKVESNHYASRESVLKFDAVINEQRDIVYEERNKVLDGEDLSEFVQNTIRVKIDEYVRKSLDSGLGSADWDMTELKELITSLMPVDRKEIESLKQKCDTVDEVIVMLNEIASNIYNEKVRAFDTEEQFKSIERTILLKVLDSKWTNHIDDMDHVKQGIGLQALAQKDPYVEYKLTGYEMFNEMILSMKEDVAKIIMHMQVTSVPNENVESNGFTAEMVATPEVAVNEEDVSTEVTIQSELSDATIADDVIVEDELMNTTDDGVVIILEADEAEALDECSEDKVDAESLSEKQPMFDENIESAEK